MNTNPVGVHAVVGENALLTWYSGEPPRLVRSPARLPQELYLTRRGEEAHHGGSRVSTPMGREVVVWYTQE